MLMLCYSSFPRAEWHVTRPRSSPSPSADADAAAADVVEHAACFADADEEVVW